MLTTVARIAVASLLAGMVITALQSTATEKDSGEVHTAIFDYHNTKP